MERCHLKYAAPGSGGWGIVRVGLLVPESVMLFVAPAGCGRHGAIAGYLLGYGKRLFYLRVEESDIVTGKHLDKVYLAVDEIVATVKPCPKAILVCGTCMDTLLASDYPHICSQLEKKHGIKVKNCYMDPITRDGKKTPEIKIQQSVYDCLTPNTSCKEPVVNIIGNFVPVMKNCEIYQLVKQAGIKEIRQIGDCKTFDDFEKLSRACLNILIKPNGLAAAADMEKKHNIQFCDIGHYYDIDLIHLSYVKLGQALGVELDDSRYYQEAQKNIRYYVQKFSHLKFAIGQSVNGSPFEITCALSKYGFDVPYIFSDKFLDTDKPYITWLSKNRPETKVYAIGHPTMVEVYETESISMDVAIGLDSGYYCKSAQSFPWDSSCQPYGYKGLIALFREIETSLENKKNHREQLSASPIVI
jgi:nitrogenase molybdenum-cofactor synthesis protein NifE